MKMPVILDLAKNGYGLLYFKIQSEAKNLMVLQKCLFFCDKLLV